MDLQTEILLILLARSVSVFLGLANALSKADWEMQSNT